jgi:3D (Asp-Asp-Asp) domain-containing protein/peptidoglycan hydrolase-like protein with peptidoglycan-binding domain
MFNQFNPPSNLNALTKKQLWATYYYIYSAKPIKSSEKGIMLLGKGDQSLGIKLTEKDYCLAAIEGTVITQRADGSAVTLNFLDAGASSQLCDCTKYADVSAATGKTRFREARGTYGDGAAKFLLRPFRTLAVDKKEIPLGTVIYIEAARGVPITLPDGSTAIHDGYFFAGDVGGKIKGNHIDVFQAMLRSKPFAPFIKSSSVGTFDAYVVTDAAVIQALTDEHLGKSVPVADSALVMTTEEAESLQPATSSLEFIKRGSKGPAVRRWQTFLQGQGFDPKGIDGTFGKDTETATIAFQRKHKLKADGEVGRESWGKAVMLGLPVVEETRPASDKSGDNWPPRPTNLQQLSHEERVARFGSFSFRHAPEPDNFENIEITDDWESKNIKRIELPALKTLKGGASGRVRLHKDLEQDFLALWAAWEKAGLLDRLLTWEGMFNARFKRKTSAANIQNKNPRSLSNHSWGTAFDVNYQWNKLDTIPALLGEKGCVRELVEIANKHGFYWGGHFKSPRDGMHFEAGKRV